MGLSGPLICLFFALNCMYVCMYVCMHVMYAYICVMHEYMQCMYVSVFVKCRDVFKIFVSVLHISAFVCMHLTNDLVHAPVPLAISPGCSMQEQALLSSLLSQTEPEQVSAEDRRSVRLDCIGSLCGHSSFGFKLYHPISRSLPWRQS